MVGDSSVPNDHSSVDNSESTPTENKASSILKDFFDKSATSWIVLLLITLLGTNMFQRHGKVEQGTEELLTWMLKLKDVDQGNRITQSWVAFTDSERLIGEAAKNLAAVNPERTIFDVKRFIGQKFEDKEVQRISKCHQVCWSHYGAKCG
ncbi:hypothetical protein ACFE04_022586 [Oxalis oulophora]